ncbi:MAG: transposase [Polyangiales bacterium]
MKRKRYTESQIIGILKEAEQGEPVTDLCRKHGMANATFYAWRRKYAGMDVAEARRLKQLEDEIGASRSSWRTKRSTSIC